MYAVYKLYFYKSKHTQISHVNIIMYHTFNGAIICQKVM